MSVERAVVEYLLAKDPEFAEYLLTRPDASARAGAINELPTLTQAQIDRAVADPDYFVRKAIAERRDLPTKSLTALASDRGVMRNMIMHRAKLPAQVVHAMAKEILVAADEPAAPGQYHSSTPESFARNALELLLSYQTVPAADLRRMAHSPRTWIRSMVAGAAANLPNDVIRCLSGDPHTRGRLVKNRRVTLPGSVLDSVLAQGTPGELRILASRTDLPDAFVVRCAEELKRGRADRDTRHHFASMAVNARYRLAQAQSGPDAPGQSVA